MSLLVGSAEHATSAIVLEIRLPRALLAALVGAGLATAGALLQALLQNPLADPYVLGISGGAALGGVLALALGGGVWFGLMSVPLVAFAGALAREPAALRDRGRGRARAGAQPAAHRASCSTRSRRR